jgi:hypothetical protein
VIVPNRIEQAARGGACGNAQLDFR